MSKNQRNDPKWVPNKHADLPLQAHLALVDYLSELRRLDRGVMARTDHLIDPFKIPEDTGIKTNVTRIKYEGRVAPSKAFVRSLGMDALVASEVAEELNVSPIHIRRLIDHPDLDAPSYVVPYGKNHIYLYTPEDVEELRKFIAKQRGPQPRKKKS
jgi:hypothetical protein